MFKWFRKILTLGQTEDLPAYVVLLRDHESFSEQQLIDFAIRASEGKYNAEKDFVATSHPDSLMVCDGHWFSIFDMQCAFFPKDEQPPEKMFPDPKMRQAIKDHKSWLGIDLASADTSDDAIYFLARFAASVAETHGLAVLYTPERLSVAYNPEVGERLWSKSPRTAFPDRGWH